jgi:DNA polymerase-3 subunit alpha
MEYIPAFVNRKHGREPIKYDLADMEEFLAETYGITVYQEQVMLLSQKLAGFSKGDADVLRKAMGKKQKAVLDKMKDKFIQGCAERGHAKEICEKVWTDWEAFAQYAFNKSHSTCYSLVAYHTAYLKANYPAEYMAAVLTHSQSNLESVTFHIEECRSRGIKVLGPHVNESGVYFEVNKAGDIRFGLGAIKGAGDAAVEAIIQEREARGPFNEIFDFAKRMTQRSVNKKTFECLALSGAFDCFQGVHRRQYVFAKDGDISLLEKAIKYAIKTQQEEQSAQASLFGGSSGTVMPKPKVDFVEPFSDIEKLNLEKEVVGIYISGHPLDNFKFEMDAFCTVACSQLAELDSMLGRELKLGGIVSGVEHRTTKTGKPFGKFTLEDYNGNYTFTLFGEDYLKFKNFMNIGWFLFIEGAVIKNSWGQQNIEYKIRNIDLLNEIGVKRSKGLRLRINAHEVTRELIRQIEEVCQEYAGNAPLYLKIQDGQDTIHSVISKRFRVNPVNDMVVKMKKAGELAVEVVF